MSPSLLPVVHAVTTDEIVRRPAFVRQARSVMEALGRRGAVQLRAPSLDGASLTELARSLVRLQEETGAWVVVTDRVDVAAAVGARGAQLTRRSLGVAEAARAAPGLALGASVHSVAEGIAAARDGAAWAVVGRTVSLGLSTDKASPFLRELATRSAIPVLVIGGVVPQHVPALRAIGVHGVAAIRGIWDAEHAGVAAADYLTAHDAKPLGT